MLVYTFNVLPTAFKIVMVSAGLRQSKKAEGDADHLVDVGGEVILVPADHEDGGLQSDLES